MKVFFTASQRGKKYFENYYKTIFKLIAKLGYEHVSDDLLTISSDDFYHKFEKVGRKAYVQFYKDKISSVQKADICIFDITMHSLSIGFTIQKSLDYNKPTIVVYLKDNVPHLLTGIQDEKLIIKSYTENTLEKVIKDALKEAESLREKRFNFFISPSLLAYINDVSKTLGITKSTFIRNLIIEHKNKNLKI